MKTSKSSDSPSSSRSYCRASSSTSSGRSTPTSWEAREAGYGVISPPALPGVNSIDSPGSTASGSRTNKRGMYILEADSSIQKKILPPLIVVGDCM